MVTEVSTGLNTRQTTDAQGQYLFSTLSPGTYQISVLKEGFETLIVKGVSLSVQETATRDLQLSLGAVSTAVTVTAEDAHVNTESTTVSTVVDRQFVANLPLNGRSFQSLIDLTPGVILTQTNYQEELGQFSVNGQRAGSNYYLIDGVSANFGVSGTDYYGEVSNGGLLASSAVGGTNNLVSVDALQEFRIQTSTYDAESGRMSGAQISLLTRSGTNEFHGNLFEYLRNDAFDANDWFADNQRLPKPGVKQNDFGGTVGGPLFPNHAFFFASYEGLRLLQPEVEITDVPSLTARQLAPASVQPFLNGFPIPNGPDTGSFQSQYSASFDDRSHLDAGSLRLDDTITSRLNVFARYTYAPSETIQRGQGGALNYIVYTPVDTQTATVGATATLTNTLVNDVRVNYSQAKGGSRYGMDSFGGAVVPDASLMFPTGFGSPADSNVAIDFATLRNGLYQQGIVSKNIQRQFNLVDTLSLAAGKHDIRMGADFRHMAPAQQRRKEGLVYAWLTGVTDAVLGFADYALTETTSIQPQLVFYNFSVFAQDIWKITPRLTLNYGLREEYNPPPGETSGHAPFALSQVTDLSDITLAPPGTPLWHATKVNLAPRAGVSYRLNEHGEQPTVVRAGFGIFYDLGTSAAASVGTIERAPYSTIGMTLGSPLPFIGAPPAAITQPPFNANSVIEGFDPHLKLPYSEEWSVAIETAFSKSDTGSASYLGSAGHRLMREEYLNGVSSQFATLALNTNQSYSNFDALQLQYNHHLSRGVRALVSYTWAHSLDLNSTDLSNPSGSDGSGLPANLYNIRTDYGDSNFDIRHALSAGFTAEVPDENFESRIANTLVNGWGLDGTFQFRTGTPFTVIYTPTSSQYVAIGGQPINLRPDRVASEPLYVHDPAAPAKRYLNTAAFAVPAVSRQGSEGRNTIRAFNVTELDLSARREFLLVREAKLLFRADLFNVFNHPNFATPENNLSVTGFGYSQSMFATGLGQGGGFSGGSNPLYQLGGPRSMQLSLKVQF